MLGFTASSFLSWWSDVLSSTGLTGLKCPAVPTHKWRWITHLNGWGSSLRLTSWLKGLGSRMLVLWEKSLIKRALIIDWLKTISIQLQYVWDKTSKITWHILKQLLPLTRHMAIHKTGNGSGKLKITGSLSLRKVTKRVKVYWWDCQTTPKRKTSFYKKDLANRMNVSINFNFNYFLEMKPFLQPLPYCEFVKSWQYKLYENDPKR